MKRTIPFIFIITILFSLPVMLFAQTANVLTREFAQDTVATDTPSVTQEKSPDLQDNDLKLFIDKIEVNGQLEKPQAMFILPGSTPDIDDIQIEHSFFKEIFRPVEKRGRIQTKITTDPSKDRKDYIPW